MKKTVYFTGSLQIVSNVEQSIKTAVSNRDIFLLDHLSEIGKIDCEDIKFVPRVEHGTASVIAIIALTYYPKQT